MKIDLSLGRCGVIGFRNGQRFNCMLLEPFDNQFQVRIESGWYYTYTQDGTLIQSGSILHKDGTKTKTPTGAGPYSRDIIEFKPNEFEEGLVSELIP